MFRHALLTYLLPRLTFPVLHNFAVSLRRASKKPRCGGTSPGDVVESKM